ncbi:MAG: hypothetical protein CL908_14575 [Deltaproteobacteria bacterium]|jgi:Flp pilus assembly protein TadD|nr:hypothetical protein [Deltaproteobacteria bacterium]
MNGEVEVVEARGNAGRELEGEAGSLLERARVCLAEGANEEALECLRGAQEIAPEHATLRSMLGVATARAEADFEASRTLCESAVKQEFFNPELYLNLAQVYLHFGRRAEALRYLRRGQMIDPGHAPIVNALRSLGRRRMPILPFLPRRHVVNRALGTARDLVLESLTGG